jgi:hypothetical protein
MLHTHSGSSFRAFFDTSLRCGARCTDWIPTPTGGPRAQAREDCEVADRIGELRKIAPVDEPATHRGTPRPRSVKRTLRAATHRFLSFLSSPILSGSDSSAVASARLHDGAAHEKVPDARYKHTGRPKPIGPPLHAHQTTQKHQGGAENGGRECSRLSVQSGGVQHQELAGSGDRLGQDANARVLHVAETIAPRIHTREHKNFRYLRPLPRSFA